MNYYNEIQPEMAQFLRELIREDLIPYGDVDERSIEDVLPADLAGYTQWHFFAGAAGWPLALRMVGWPDDRPVSSGSCPCQPFSQAGEGKGFADERHLLPDFLWLIEQCGFPVVVGEQVAGNAIGAWVDLLHDGLEGLGYATGTVAFPACSVGAKHVRQRTYWAAVADPFGNQQPRQEQRRWQAGRVGRLIEPVSWDEPWQDALSRMGVLANGLPRCVAGTDAARNAIVPQQAAAFLRSLM